VMLGDSVRDTEDAVWNVKCLQNVTSATDFVAFTEIVYNWECISVVM
jgi:hypothetical protein